MQKKKWWESIDHDPRFEDSKFYAVIHDASSHSMGPNNMEVYGPFENSDEVAEWYKKLGFRYKEEVGWEMEPITVLEAGGLGKEATILNDPTQPHLDGWETKGEWIQSNLQNHRPPGVPPPSEPLRKPDSARESRYANVFHMPNF